MITSSRNAISPLRATFVAALLLAAAAVPLAKLTGHSTPPATPAETTPAPVGSLPCVLRLRTFDPLENLSLRTIDGSLLFSAPKKDPGETEHEITISLVDLETVVVLQAEGTPKDTAVALTLLPDGLEEKTLWLAGSGGVDGSLRFDWNHPEEP